MNRFAIIIILVFLAKTQNGIGQQIVDDTKAHRRYWYYRTRMINDFMKIGKEQGACIVLAQRNNGEDGSAPKELQSKVGPDQIDITNQYIMALALEYKILSRNHQDTRGTVKELFYMLYAINRLDLEAEQFFTPGMRPNTEIVTQNGQANGFILREDMPKSFFTQNKLHFNYALQERPIGSTDPDENYGGFTGLQHTNDLSDDNKFSGYFPSQNQPLEDLTLVQDKYMSMLTAMMFVTKYIPVGEQVPNEVFQDQETSIHQEAAKIASRCYDYLKNKNGLWDLHYEDNNGNFLYPLTVGHTAFTYSWALSRMACWANSPFPWAQNNPFQCLNYNDPVATQGGRAAYNAITIAATTCKEDNAVFKAWCQAGSNSPSFTGSGLPTPIFIGMSPNTAYNSIEWADLVRKVLHQDGALLKQLSVYGDPINVAPCQGPYNYGNCTHGGWEWSSQDRLEHPQARGFGCNGNTPPHPVPCVEYIQNSGFNGNYPGVDYMLLHNLYYEYQNQLLDGNQGNNSFTLFGNVVSTIHNAVNTLPNLVNSAGCSFANALGGILLGNSNLCDPTIAPSGNGGAGSINTNLVGYPGAYNYMDNLDENIWPRDVGSPFVPIPIHGTTNHVGKVAVFQNLVSRAKIYAMVSPAATHNNIPSSVVYRAGKEIVLDGSEFWVENGATFHAYIQRYVCNGNSDPLTMRSANDSATASDASSDYETDIMNSIPIHYIESPQSDADNNPVVSRHANTEDYIADQLPLDHPKTSAFNVTPNPTTGKVNIQTNKSTEDEVFSIHVYDMKGRLIYMYENVSSDFEINLEGYSKGIYMVQVTSSLGNSITKKIDVID